MDDTTHSTENIHLQDSEAAAEEADEALSLSGLIQNSDDADNNISGHCGHFQDSRSRSSSEPSDFFEFFSQASFEMSHAEDIIFCGKLMPSYKELPERNRRHTSKHHIREDKVQSFHRRRSESMSELNTTRSNSTKSKLMRNSRSLDYQKLYGRSEKMEIERSLSSKSSGSKTDVSLKEKLPQRPRWYFWMFGLVKLPAEMALQDIKNRQVRRNPGSLFSSFNAGEKETTNRDDRRCSWEDLLRVLSCKDDASVAVATPFSRLQHA